MIVWQPQNPENSQLWHFMRFIEKKFALTLKDYFSLHRWSIQNPREFWSVLVDFFSIKFKDHPHSILNHYNHPLEAKWFTGATLNFAEILLSRRDAHPALLSYDENGKRDLLTYADLYLQVAACAQSLRSLGVKSGDRVAAVMPNISQTIIMMLATTSLGAIWASCSSDFGSEAALDRLGQIKPKILLIADGHQYAGKKYSALIKIKELCANISSIEHLIIYPILGEEISKQNLPNTLFWQDLLQNKAAECQFAHLPFDHPLYILFSSGTTGKPKCIVHGAGGTLLQHLKELGLHTDLSFKDNMCFYTTCGWMMWNWMISSLALGSTLTLYEGSPLYPDPYHLLTILENEQISVFGTSAKFISTLCKKEVYPQTRYSLKHLRTILSTGSPLLPNHYDYVYREFKSNLQVSSISGGTDIVSCFALGNPILPIYRGELQCLGLGMDVQIFNESGKSVIDTRGELVCTNAFPSMPIYFWDDPNKQKYFKTYFDRFPTVWTHGDFAKITKHGGLIIYGRSDTILNPGGVRIGTAEIYRQLEAISEIVDSVVIGQQWDDDVRIVLFVQLQAAEILTPDLKDKINQRLRQHASPKHVPAIILQVPDIPRTINGKVVELAVRQIVHGENVQNINSIANQESLAYFKNRPELQ